MGQRKVLTVHTFDLSSKIRDEARDHERRDLIYLGLDVIQFLVKFYLCWKRFWLGGYEFPPLFTKKRFTLIVTEMIFSELVVTVAL